MKNLEPYAVEQKADLETNINVYVNYYRFENGYEVETSEKPFRNAESCSLMRSSM